jgi:hypothetical protein
MRHANGDAHSKPDVNTYGNSDGNCHIHSDCDGDVYGYTYTYSWHTDCDTNRLAYGLLYPRCLGHVHAWAAGSLSCGWMHRWNKCLRVWRW